MDVFRQLYHHEHHYIGISLRTPADVHYGLTETSAGKPP